ncbi:MAG: inadl protein [Roseibium sp.]|nr:inadl protein [Roseibium sp.]
MLRTLFAAFFALFLFPSVVLAAETTVDFSSLVEPAVNGVFAVIGTVVLWLGKKALNAFELRTGLELDQQYAERLDRALMRAVDYGKSKALQVAKEHASEVDVRNELLATAASYALNSVPDALEHFNIDRERLIDMLEARIGVDLDRDGDVAGKPA